MTNSKTHKYKFKTCKQKRTHAIVLKLPDIEVDPHSRPLFPQSPQGTFFVLASISPTMRSKTCPTLQDATRQCGLPKVFEPFSIGPLLGAQRKYWTIWARISSLQVHFYRQLTNGSGQKLCRNILLHCGLVNENFHFPKNCTVFMFMIFGLRAMSRSPLCGLWLPGRGCFFSWKNTPPFWPCACPRPPRPPPPAPR